MATWVFLNRPYLPAGMAADWMRRIMTNALLIVLISLIPGVSGAAHFGGAAAGLVAAVPLTYNRFGHGWQPLLGLLGFLAVPVALIVWVEQSGNELDRARYQYFPLIRGVRETGQKFYTEQVKPLQDRLNRGLPLPPGEVNTALAVAAEAQEAIQEAAHAFRDAPKYKDPRINQALELARGYAEAWLHFLERFRQLLGRHPNLTPEEAISLFSLIEPINHSRDQVEDSILFPRQ
jgi:hypothetical protein